jgi:predicted nucleic acid-binding protein
MPDAPRLVVSNTTPIITLLLVGQLSLLQRLYGMVLVPTAVHTEINIAIEHTQREIELIEEYRTTLIAHTVTGKIDLR